jgi:sialate O-acetylesterase
MCHRARKWHIFAISTKKFVTFATSMQLFMKKIFFICATLFCLTTINAKVTMPQLFQSGMVMQRGKIIPVWGKADAGETVTIRFNKKQFQTTADANGRWQVDLPKMKAGGPYQMTINEQTMPTPNKYIRNLSHHSRRLFFL